MHKSKGIISALETEGKQFQIAIVSLPNGCHDGEFESQRPNKTIFIACLVNCLPSHHKHKKGSYGTNKFF